MSDFSVEGLTIAGERVSVVLCPDPDPDWLRIRVHAPQASVTRLPREDVSDALRKVSGRVLFKPAPAERLAEFLDYCDRLEEHPFFLALKGGGKLILSSSFPEEGKDTADVNFDEIHLESFLCRLRQFLFPRELFSHRAIHRSINDVFGADPDFLAFYECLCAAFKQKFPKGAVEVFGSNGRDIVAAATIKDLIEAALYTGAIHSERRLNAEEGTLTQAATNAHVAAKKHLLLTLAFSSLKVTENVFVLRTWLLKRARETNGLDKVRGLRRFDARCLAAGC